MTILLPVPSVILEISWAHDSGIHLQIRKGCAPTLPSEIRKTEHRKQKLQGLRRRTNNTKPVVVAEPVARFAPVAISGTTVPADVVPGAATQHAIGT